MYRISRVFLRQKRWRPLANSELNHANLQTLTNSFTMILIVTEGRTYVSDRHGLVIGAILYQKQMCTMN